MRKEAKAYAEEMIEGDYTSYHIQKSSQKDIPQYTEQSSKCPTCKGSVRTLLNNLADAPSQWADDLARKFLCEWQDDGRDLQTKLALGLDAVKAGETINIRRVGWAEAIRYLRNLAGKRGFATSGRYADLLDANWPRWYHEPETPIGGHTDKAVYGG